MNKKFSYSDDDKDLLKVTKHIEIEGQKLIDEIQTTKENIESAKSSAKEESLLDELEKKLGVSPTDYLKNRAVVEQGSQQLSQLETKLNLEPIHIIVPDKTIATPAKLQTWDEILAEANQVITTDVTFEDLLTTQEIEHALKNLDDIEHKFSAITGLKKKDWAFLFVATALQCVRQYVIDPWLRKMRKDAQGFDESKDHKGNAQAGWYYVETEKILATAVPYDAQIYNPANPTVAGFLKGAKDHRYVTLGHDPLLGWVFGTTNILTGTITRYDFRSAHVKYQQGTGHIIHSLASTTKIFTSCTDRALHEGSDGKLAVGCAVVREGIHLTSDVFTKDSLPFPIVETLSPKLAEKLASYGIDMAGVSTSMALSGLINSLIGMVHRLCFDASVDDPKLYEVRTRKILLYSNLIASSSNAIVALLTKDLERLDVGGLLVTITRLFKDVRFIAKVKQDFIQSQFDIQFKGLADEIDMLYKDIADFKF